MNATFTSLRRSIISLCTVFLAVVHVFAQANGKMQIHFMDVGQGDGAVLISPGGTVVLFDDGVLKNCDKPISYLQQLGVTKIDYHVTSHYHSDHIGCCAQVLHEFPLQGEAFDRGESYNSGTFQSYVQTVGNHRKTPAVGQILTLDAGGANAVKITFVAMNANGIQTDDENDKSLDAVIEFGSFRAEIGGDLSGFDTQRYKDIETSVADKVGEIDVYKVHHHGSSHSTNPHWLSVTKPTVGVISCGDGNSYGHPTLECLETLHNANVRTYWTETGNGVTPEPGQDIVGGNIILEIAPGDDSFTITYKGTQVDKYRCKKASGAAPTVVSTVNNPTEAVQQYAWSKRSQVYHVQQCRFVDNISPQNLERGSQPPPGKTRHEGCPK
jgi:beta-lactamase superfamily II metal-dependent hydrolase